MYEICGPEPLGGNEIADRFTARLGRQITFRPMPPREFGDILDDIYGPGAGAGATDFYEAARANPALVSTNVDIGRRHDRQ